MPISLVNIAKYYKGEPNQDKALQILQQELEKAYAHLLDADSEFVKLWKNPEETQLTPAVEASATVGSGSAKTATATGGGAGNKGLPDKVQLDVPYFTQLDNEQNPHGSCNVTSVSMCIVYLGHSSTGANGGQLEDELYSYCLNNGLSRHSPTDLAKLIQIYGYKDDFQEDAKWGDVKKWLAAGNPCIVHGWFTRSGHIVTIIGYNEKGWIIHDPYGEWYEWGYDTSVSGKALTYSYGMMKEICGSDGDLWIHYVSK